jgi:ATP-binding cassette subfamily B protein
MFGGSGGGNWRSFVRFDEQRDRPQVSRQLLRRVAAYARPYRFSIVVMLVAILLSSLLALLPPLLLRDLIDHALPNGTRPGNLRRLNPLALGMIALPLLSGLINVFQGAQSACVGEGRLRALYDHMQRMALRFFTNTKSGALLVKLFGRRREVTKFMEHQPA